MKRTKPNFYINFEWQWQWQYWHGYSLTYLKIGQQGKQYIASSYGLTLYDNQYNPIQRGNHKQYKNTIIDVIRILLPAAIIVVI